MRAFRGTITGTDYRPPVAPGDEGLIELTLKVKVDPLSFIDAPGDPAQLELLAADWVRSVVPSARYSVVGQVRARTL
jgi:hypothetical protein